MKSNIICVIIILGCIIALVILAFPLSAHTVSKVAYPNRERIMLKTCFPAGKYTVTEETKVICEPYKEEILNNLKGE